MKFSVKYDAISMHTSQHLGSLPGKTVYLRPDHVRADVQPEVEHRVQRKERAVCRAEIRYRMSFMLEKAPVVAQSRPNEL